ncbi:MULTISPECIES: D-alanyl-lipoteichoic acid biosynthesis protein DltB [Eubacteriales]|uniref:Teichoic acid D-alanyltransferase n=1 Tax=Bittarella massiliensis (ex Durand et al. 2017) TaxID=1720313 RepID=A0AAQ1ME40_9FIRM|nr:MULTISPECIES: D-alanyl-lipoteichoic acid biosynthesis protein DltB [Eubacteriales]ERI99952.1 putative protein DltB [Clostridium sp. ATCC 29733]MZL68268.1 D-alanyl-lipoteichoic acid biosynthesis protein DltB [Bittarella massiliensis (ex Durand et al. 2017)]MZL79677.1 D-alanyl-lipoteichoic acid biosynthesis protein DltB [Bittarella massiliensis (ex Durand et al. 2017)]SHG22294.1 membrane protein involved in D-alanine export [Bittarella massiliensis (ex Durand et al. 2017)]
MSFYGDLRFFLVLAAALVPAAVLGLRERSLKGYSFALSLLFIWLVYGGQPAQLLWLAGFYLLELHAVKGYLLLRRKFGRNSVIYGHFVALALAPLLLYKFSGLFGKSVFGFLGISYLSFKVLQVIIEIYDGVIKEMGGLELSSFLLLFPAISSGPIDRSRRFLADWHTVYSREEYRKLLGTGLQKIALGLFYKYALSQLFYQVMGRFAHRYRPLPLAGYGYSYGFYLFFDFAGYSLMAIGVSYILGIRTPENFDKPFLSVDMKDFWNRWHITLSHWFRDFLFSRFMMNAIRKKWFSSRLNGAAAGLVVNMLVMGLWHGFTGCYIAYGLYHGMLLALTEIYQKKSAFYKRNRDKGWYKALSWFVTLQLVMVGFLIFSGAMAEAGRAVLAKLI